MHSLIYTDRWLSTSSGRWPSGFFARLISFLGFDSAIESDRCSPTDFQNDFSGGTRRWLSWASLAKVSRWPTKPARSSYPTSGSNRSLCFNEMANARMRFIAVSFSRRSSFWRSPSRSAMLIQIVRARLRDDWWSKAQYLRPLAHL